MNGVKQFKKGVNSPRKIDIFDRSKDVHFGGLFCVRLGVAKWDQSEIVRLTKWERFTGLLPNHQSPRTMHRLCGGAILEAGSSGFLTKSNHVGPRLRLQSSSSRAICHIGDRKNSFAISTSSSSSSSSSSSTRRFATFSRENATIVEDIFTYRHLSKT